MGGIAEHDIAQLGSRRGCNDLSAEAVLVERGQHARVVDVGMCHDDKIDFGSRDRKRNILIGHSALAHPTVNQNIF